MSNNNNSTLLPGLIFGSFVALKLTSPYVALWSWWWLLMPIVPVIAFTLHYFGAV